MSVFMNRPAPRLRGILVLTATLTALVAGPAAAQIAAPDETTTATAVETDPTHATDPTPDPDVPAADAADADAPDAEALRAPAPDVADDVVSADASEAKAPDAEAPDAEALDAEALDAEAATTAAVSSAACQVLTRLTPEAVDGDERAVTITSQTFDAGEPGWSAVQWEVDATVEATHLLIAHRDGSTVEAADPYRGFAADVLELTLCGRRAGTSGGDDTSGEGTDDGAGTPDDGTPDTAGPDREGSGGDTLPATGPTTRVAALGATGLAMATAGLVLLRATTSPRRRRPHDATNLGGTA